MADFSDKMKALSKLPDNKICADCGERGNNYVNLTVFSFVCTTCSGLVRGLTPPHRVKALSMSKFSEEDVKKMTEKGNKYNKHFFLAQFDHKIPDKDKKPGEFKTFLTYKYEQMRWRSFDGPGANANAGSSSESYGKSAVVTSTASTSGGDDWGNFTTSKPTAASASTNYGFCSKCGSPKIKSDDKFCHNCGNRHDDAPQPQQVSNLVSMSQSGLSGSLERLKNASASQSPVQIPHISQHTTTTPPKVNITVPVASSENNPADLFSADFSSIGGGKSAWGGITANAKNPVQSTPTPDVSPDKLIKKKGSSQALMGSLPSSPEGPKPEEVPVWVKDVSRTSQAQLQSDTPVALSNDGWGDFTKTEAPAAPTTKSADDPWGSFASSSTSSVTQSVPATTAGNDWGAFASSDAKPSGDMPNLSGLSLGGNTSAAASSSNPPPPDYKSLFAQGGTTMGQQQPMGIGQMSGQQQSTMGMGQMGGGQNMMGQQQPVMGMGQMSGGQNMMGQQQPMMGMGQMSGGQNMMGQQQPMMGMGQTNNGGYQMQQGGMMGMGGQSHPGQGLFASEQPQEVAAAEPPKPTGNEFADLFSFK